jgi:hypothetical protein
MAKVKHYINLHAKDLFVERGIESLDRLGPGVYLRAKFQKVDPMLVSFRVVMVSETSPYTASEKQRNIWYALQEPIGLDINEGDEMNATCVALLPPSGGAVYKIEARAGDKTVASTDEIETWRRLFFQVFHMTGVSVPGLQPTIDYYKTLFIEWLDCPAGQTTEIPFLEHATQNNLVNFVIPKYGLLSREPWALALVFSNSLPGISEIEVGGPVFSGNVDLPSKWFSGNDELIYELPEGRYVWWKINPVDDAANGGKGIWLRGDGKLTIDGKDVVVPKASITIVTSHSLRNGNGFNRLKIKLPEAARNQNLLFGKSAKLTLTLWVVDGFAGGFAMGNQNLLTVALTSWWRKAQDNKTDNERLQVLNHELGHKVGMVAKGGRRFGGPYELDAPDKLYGDIDIIYAGPNPSRQLKDELKVHNNAKGHRGAHCERGATGKKEGDVWKWTGTPACTMFGATSTDDALSPHKFCSPCSKIVVRQNLDPAVPEGPQGFKSLLGGD